MCKVTLDGRETLKRINASQLAKEREEEAFFLRGDYAPNGYGKQREEYIKEKIKVLEKSLYECKRELKELKQLYYLKVTDDSFAYLNLDLDLNAETWEVATKGETNGYQTRFTKEEIMDINKGLWGIAVPVEEDDRRY